MNATLSHELRYLAPAWLASVLLPWPVLLLWRSADGSALALGLFFVGSASLVAFSFQRDVNATGEGESGHRGRIWRRRMAGPGVAQLSAWAVFSLAHLLLIDRHDYISVLLALSALIPCCCIVPYLTLITRKPFAAVAFTVFLVGCMKLLGCVVVVLVHGWDASEHGHTTMPWAHPNLLVWVFWANTGVLSLVCYWLGASCFRDRAAEQGAVPEAGGIPSI